MATRSGTVDPGLVLWLLQYGGFAADEVASARSSRNPGSPASPGIAGGDLRDVLAARAERRRGATLAFDVYVHRLRRELGAMIAVLGGLDVLVFTGGVGEHAPEVRTAACEQLGFAGVRLDADATLASRARARSAPPEPGADLRRHRTRRRRDRPAGPRSVAPGVTRSSRGGAKRSVSPESRACSRPRPPACAFPTPPRWPSAG